MGQGYYAFLNASANGPVDLVAVKADTGETLLIDVKSVNTYVDKSGVLRVSEPNLRILTAVQRALGVRLVFFNQETSECWWAGPTPPLEPTQAELPGADVEAVKATCLWCGKFFSSRRNALYCGRSCKNSAGKRRRLEAARRDAEALH
jgi:hypothetical protein